MLRSFFLRTSILARLLIGFAFLCVNLLVPVSGSAAGLEGFLGVGISGDPSDDDGVGYLDLGVGYHLSPGISVGIEGFGLLRPHGSFSEKWSPNLYARLSLLPKRVFDPYLRFGVGSVDYGEREFSILTAAGVQLGSKRISVFMEGMQRSREFRGMLFMDAVGITSIGIGVRVHHVPIGE